jgi:hypothetical protein
MENYLGLEKYSLLVECFLLKGRTCIKPESMIRSINFMLLNF